MFKDDCKYIYFNNLSKYPKLKSHSLRSMSKLDAEKKIPLKIMIIMIKIVYMRMMMMMIM